MEFYATHNVYNNDEANAHKVLLPYLEGTHTEMVMFDISLEVSSDLPLPGNITISSSTRELSVSSKNITNTRHTILFSSNDKDFSGKVSIQNTYEGDKAAYYTISSSSQELLDSVVQQITGLYSFEEAPNETDIKFNFVTLNRSSSGASVKKRALSCPAWSEIRQNYVPSVRDAIDPIMSMTADTVRGKILLLHGPAGSGKTSMLRALGREIKDWCDVYVVLDPEQMFSNTTYLTQAMYATESSYDDFFEEGERRGKKKENKWKLFILEDCGELIKEDADGQALSRLLNATDGILGQGLNVMFAVTTNEDFLSLHQAVSRPGRSMGSIGVGHFGQEEAQAWLSERGCQTKVGTNGASLAELYAILNDALIENQKVSNGVSKTKIGFTA